MHDKFQLIDITCALLLLVTIYGLARIGKEARANGRTISEFEQRGGIMLLVFFVVTPFSFRWFQQAAPAISVFLCLVLPVCITSIRKRPTKANH